MELDFYDKLSLILMVEVVAVCLLSYTSVEVGNYLDCQMTGKQPQYYNKAPNGEYEVLIWIGNNSLCPPSKLCFPLCPSYGGELHGEFNVLEELFPFENGWALVTLENNIITEVNYLGT